MTQEEMVRNTIKHANGRPVIVKRHPLCSHPSSLKIITEATSWGKHVYTTQMNIHDILPNCYKVVCANSGAGFEALMHLKQVVTVGRSDYHHITAHFEKDGNVEQLYTQPDRTEQDIIKYLYWYLDQQVIDAQSDNFDAKVIRKISQSGWIT